MTLSDDDSTTEDIPGPSCSESLRRPQFENQRIVDVEAEISLLLAPLNFEERRKFKVTKEDALQLDQIHQQVFAIISGQRELVPQRYRRLKDAFDHSKCVREQIYILRGDASVVEDRECTTTYLNRLSNALNSIVDASFDEEYRKSAILLGLVDGLAEVLILEVQVFKVNLKSNEHRSIRKSIANGLTNLTFKQPLSKQRLCLYNRFIDTVVLIIENAPNLVQVYASIIRNLSWKAEDELAGARLSSCVPALAMALVRAHSQSDKLCVQATLCALWNLASHSNNNKATICNTPHCLQVLAMLLDCDPAKASSVESASGILKYVTQYLSTTSTHLDVRPELVRRLLDLLFDGSFTTITNALGALTNLVVKDPHLQNLIRHNARAMQQLNSLRNCARDDIRGAVKNILNHINQPSSTRYGGMSYSYMDQNSMSMQSSTDRFNYPPMNPSQTISPRLLPLRMNRPSPGASGIPMIQPFEGRSASLPRYLHNTQRQNESHLSPGGGFNMGPRHQQQNQELQNKDPEQDHPDIDLNEASESILCTRGGSTSSINNLSEQPSGGWCSTAETERSSARLSPVSLSELPSSPTLCGVMNQPQLPLSQIDPTGTEMGKNQNEAGGSTASTALVADQVTPTVGQVGPGRISDMHPGYQPMIIPMISQDVQNQSYHGPNVIDSPDDNLPAPSMGDDFYATLQMDVDLLTRSIESALPTSNFNSPGGQHHSRRRYQRSDEVNTSSRRHSGSRRSGGAIQTDNERLLREAILSEMPQQNGQQIMTPKGSKNAWGDFCETEKSSKRRDAVGRPEKNAFDDGPFNDNDMSSDSSISSTVDLSIPTDCNGDDLIVDCKLAMKRKTKPPASHLPLPANHAKTTLRITRSPAARKFQMNQNNSSSNKIAATVSPYNYEKSALNNRPQNSIQATTTSNTSNTNSTKNTSSTIQSNPKQIMIWWVLFLPIIFCSALDQDPVNQLCSPKFFPPNSSTPLSLQQSLNLPNSYFVSGVLTDWITSKIALIEEEVWDLGASSIVKISNKSLDLTWIKDGEDTYFINKTDNTCAYNKTLQVPYGISDRVLKMFNSTGQTLASIVKSVIDFSNSTTGYYITEKQPPVVAGMEGIHWLACKNGSKPEDPALLVEVLFSGDQIEPPTLNISKQIMLSLRIGEFNGSFTENNTSPYSYIHIEFDKLALAKPKETQIKLPPGQVCSGLKNTTLPLKQVDEFYGVIEDEVKLTSTKVFYSSSNGIVAESSSAKPYPFFNEASDAAQIVHSFKYGYEFTFSQTNCQEMKTLLNTTNDVVTDDKGLHLKPFLQILFNTNLNFSKFTPTKTEGNITVDVYRATDLDNSTVELFIIKDELYSIRRYVNNELKSDQRIIPLPINGFSLSQLEFGLRSCYQPPTISSHVDTVMVELPGKSLADVFSVGLETFTNAFAQAMNQIGQISPLRISVFPVIKSSEALDLVVNVAEKTQIQPGSVGANFTTEDVSSAFIEALNKTLAKGDIEFKVNQQSWKISSNTLTRFPEAHTKCWYGFSGGSMFVLGIFAFMLGIALGAGGILFINRRKQISTLAYQVFE